ncbi:MAG: tyrosine-protein kinase family protein [bacterium]
MLFGKQVQNECLPISKEYNDSPSNTEFQRLVAKLDSLRNGQDKQAVLITSALMGEGKSTISSRLAMAIARNRMVATLLVDMDLRRPSQHKVFGMKPNLGVVDCLEGRVSLEWCIKKTQVPNLKLLTSGSLKSNPLELLTIENLKRFLEQLKSHFDYIILDTAPIIPVSDPLILGRLVDEVIIVIKAGQTSKKMVGRALEMMEKVNVKVSGFILNNLMDILPYYYNHNFYQYDYYTTKY